MKRTLVVSLGLLLSAVGSRGYAAPSSEAGTSAAQILTSRFGARPAGMGNAYTAVADDINAMIINPAGLGRLRFMELTAMEREAVNDITQSNFGLLVPLGAATAENVGNFGAIGIGLALRDYGDITARDASGNFLGNSSSNDRLGSISYGKPIGAGFYGGFNAKQYRLNIAGANTDGRALDVGLLYEAAPDKVTLGLAARNLGSDVRFGDTNEPLPSAIVGGLAVKPFKDRMTLALDLEKPRDDSTRYKLGAELWASSVFAIRGGYDSSFDAGTGFSGGVGIKIDQFEVGFFPIDRISFDYSFTPTKDFGTVQELSISLRFWGQ